MYKAKKLIFTSIHYLNIALIKTTKTSTDKNKNYLWYDSSIYTYTSQLEYFIIARNRVMIVDASSHPPMSVRNYWNKIK